MKITTGTIEVNEAGLIINNFKTKSGFKPVYVLEQSHSIRLLMKGERIPMLINVASITDYSMNSVFNLFTQDNLTSVSKLAIFMSSETKCSIINLLLKFKNTACSVRVFTDYEEASKWLKA